MKSFRTLFKYFKWKILLILLIAAAIGGTIIGYLCVQLYQLQTGNDLHLGLMWMTLIVVYAFTFMLTILGNWARLASMLHDKKVLFLEPGVLPAGYRVVCGPGKNDEGKPSDYYDELDDSEDQTKARCFVVKSCHEVNMANDEMKKAFGMIIKDKTNYGDDKEDPLTLAKKTWASYKKQIMKYDEAGEGEGLHYSFVELEDEKKGGKPYRWSISQGNDTKNETYHQAYVLLLETRLPFHKALPFNNKMKVPFGMFNFKHGIAEFVRYVPKPEVLLGEDYLEIPKLKITGCSGYDGQEITVVPDDATAQALMDEQALADWVMREHIQLAPQLTKLRNQDVKEQADDDDTKNRDLERQAKLRLANVVGQFRKIHPEVDKQALPVLYVIIYFLVATTGGFCLLWILSMVLHWTV